MKLLQWVFVSMVVVAAGLALPSPGHALVAKRVVAADKVPSRQVLRDTGFEERAEGRLAAWTFWQVGYEVTEKEKHSGNNAVVCRLTDVSVQRGASQVVELNQSVPMPVTATGWSKAVDVSGSPNSDYSIYLDLEYQDGTPLWGQTGNFSTGTHDWQKRTVTVVPSKPLKQITVHAIFRGHTGTAYFDDFELRELQSPEGASSFDGVYVLPEGKAQPQPNDWVELGSIKNLSLRISPSTGLISLGHGPAGGGILLRDVAADSDFHRLAGVPRKIDKGWWFEGDVKELGLHCSVVIAELPSALRVDATIQGSANAERAVSVYFAVPVEGTRWHDDPRRSRVIEARNEYRNTVPDGAGARGCHSLYPLGCVNNERAGMALAMPLDMPRLSRFAYNGDSRELFAGFDFGLTPATKKAPSTATFSLVLYPADPRWGMRSALERFYKLFPEHFKKRVTREGLWQAFADIAAIENPEDFHFGFKEGNDNVAWDDEHDILTFVYTEPMTYWQSLPKEVARTYEASVAYLDESAKSPNQGPREQATYCRTSAARDEAGRYSMSIENAPWCDGAVFCLNADPDVPVKPGEISKGSYELRNVERSFETRSAGLANWNSFGSGYEIDRTVAHAGQQSIRCEAREAGGSNGASQRVTVGQTEPSPLELSGWSKAEGVTGEADNSYSLYADLVLKDGSNLWGQIATFATGTHDWEKAELVIRPEKPVQSATVHCLFRNNHTGTVWFDDIFFGPVESKTNLLETADFEAAKAKPPILDGTYIDSLEGWATVRNFNTNHFASADLPLTFDPQSKRPMILTILSTYEFALELHNRMRSKGKLMMANAMLHSYSFFAWLMDVMGTETNWNPGNQWRPMGDAELLFKRSLCYQKPYCFLQNTHFDDFTYALTEKYMKRCLFYGTFPGFFSENAATNHYFLNPKWYNATRPLFKKYLPLTQTVASAGWEPVTHATTDQDKVYVERYGSPGKAVYLAVLNDSEDRRTVAVTVDAKALGLTNQRVTELVEGREPRVEKTTSRWLLREELGGEEARVYELKAPGGT